MECGSRQPHESRSQTLGAPLYRYLPSRGSGLWAQYPGLGCRVQGPRFHSQFPPFIVALGSYWPSLKIMIKVKIETVTVKSDIHKNCLAHSLANRQCLIGFDFYYY